jgi:hypothetical protein
MRTNLLFLETFRANKISIIPHVITAVSLTISPLLFLSLSLNTSVFEELIILTLILHNFQIKFNMHSYMKRPGKVSGGGTR